MDMKEYFGISGRGISLGFGEKSDQVHRPVDSFKGHSEREW